MNFLQIQNFLPKSQYMRLATSIDKLNTENRDHAFNTQLEAKKDVYKLSSLDLPIREQVDLLSGHILKDKIRELTGWEGNIYSLLEFDGLGGYCPFHTMNDGGSLAAHVDHSYIYDRKYVHIANCIYYASRYWQPGYGGQTFLSVPDRLSLCYSKMVDIKYVNPLPNSLLVFTHDSLAFHGVTRYRPLNSEPRVTFYMDYYIRAQDIGEFSKSYMLRTGKMFTHGWHLTSFIPFRTLPSAEATCQSSIRDIPVSRTSITYIRQYYRFLQSISQASPVGIDGRIMAVINMALEFVDIVLTRTLLVVLKPVYRWLISLHRLSSCCARRMTELVD